MTRLHDDRMVDQQPEVAARVFTGPIDGWLPVVAGPEEDTWRTQTMEGPVRVHLQVHAGDVWTLPDESRRRRLVVEPDRTDFHDLVVAGLTPRVTGELRLEPAGDRCRLVFEGDTRRRSSVTSTIERVVVGDPLARSGIDTLLDIIADRLAAAGPNGDANGPLHGRVRVPLPRRPRRR